MPLAECNICNRRFHGKCSLRALATHARSHKNNHSNVVSVANEHPLNTREATDLLWAVLPLNKRCSLLAKFFLDQAQDSIPGGQHDHDTVDGEVISERRAG